ncbi:MAG: hypothetical protein ACOYU4_01105 [Thermodesulfobacteriota bacterium]
MIVCFNCDTETKQKMDSLLGKDQYKDYSELIAIAISNLWLLDREVARKGALVIGNEFSSLSAGLPPTRETAKPAPTKRSPTASRPQQTPDAHYPPAEGKRPRIPDVFLLDGVGDLSIVTLEAHKDESNAGKTVTLDHWLFGQYNKLLPAKVNCRALARMTATHKGGIPIDSAASRIAEAAALLGDYLTYHDRRYKIGRNDALSTAFPRSGSEAEKSRTRYANQFVGSVNSQGQLFGLLCDYKLVALATEEPSRLLLTAPGLCLARLGNPILDGAQSEPTQKFSQEEVTFLLNHIRVFVPVEDFVFRTLLNAVREGADTPEKLDEALRPLVPADSSRSFSPSFLASQRSGALSRMADLGLITRVRNGVRVTYSITDSGQDYAETR